jgi:hypothetical protein
VKAEQEEALLAGRRSRCVSNARTQTDQVSGLRLEGLAPGAEATAIFVRYVDGELTLDQMGSEIDELHERRLGPVRLPRR